MSHSPLPPLDASPPTTVYDVASARTHLAEVTAQGHATPGMFRRLRRYLQDEATVATLDALEPRAVARRAQLVAERKEIRRRLREEPMTETDRTTQYFEAIDRREHDDAYRKVDAFRAYRELNGRDGPALSEVVPELRQELVELRDAAAAVGPRLKAAQAKYVDSKWDRPRVAPAIKALVMGGGSGGESGVRSAITAALKALSRNPTAIQGLISRIEHPDPEQFKAGGYTVEAQARVMWLDVRSVLGRGKTLLEIPAMLDHYDAQIDRLCAAGLADSEPSAGHTLTPAPPPRQREAHHGAGALGR